MASDAWSVVLPCLESGSWARDHCGTRITPHNLHSDVSSLELHSLYAFIINCKHGKNSSLLLKKQENHS